MKVPTLNVVSINTFSNFLANSAHDVDYPVLETLIEVMDDEIGLRMAKCRENDDYTQDITHGSNSSSFLKPIIVRDDDTSVDKDVTLSNDIRVTDKCLRKNRGKTKLFRWILNRIT